MRKRGGGGLFETATVINGPNGTVLHRECPRCKETCSFGRNKFLKLHGQDKCEYVPDHVRPIVYPKFNPPGEVDPGVGVPWPADLPMPDAVVEAATGATSSAAALSSSAAAAAASAVASAAAAVDVRTGDAADAECDVPMDPCPLYGCGSDVGVGEVWFDALDSFEEQATQRHTECLPSDAAATAAAFVALCDRFSVSGCDHAPLEQLVGRGLAAAVSRGSEPSLEALSTAASSSVQGMSESQSSILATLAAATHLSDDQQATLQDVFDQQQGDATDGESDSDDGGDQPEGAWVSTARDGAAVGVEAVGVGVAADDCCGHGHAHRHTSKTQSYKDRLGEPLWTCSGGNEQGQCGERCALCLHQAIFMLMSWKVDNCVNDAAFAALLGMLCEVLLPKGHVLPPTPYLFKQIMDVQDISKSEWHSCECGCTGWSPTAQTEWEDHKDDCCAKCGGMRFKRVLSRLVPVRRFWFILPEESIMELMCDPDFVTALRAKKVGRVGNFFGSLEFARLNRAVGGVLTDSQHGILELGFDFGQPYNFVQHSTGLMFMRYASLPNGASARREWHKLVMCIEGPNEPTCMDAFLLPLMDSLQRLAPPQPVSQSCHPPGQHPGGQGQVATDGVGAPTAGQSDGHGIEATPAVCDASGRVRSGAPFKHYAVLGGVYADSPAAAKLLYTIAVWTAYYVCAFCKLMGVKVLNVVRYLGYTAPVTTAAGLGAGESFQMGVGNRRIITAGEMYLQAESAEYHRRRGLAPHPGNRFKGCSPFLRSLYWVDPTTLIIVPFCHAFYLGVFKDWVKLAFAKKARSEDNGSTVEQGGSCFRIPDSLRPMLQGRVGRMLLHPSFNRKFRNPFTSVASWQIEDCARALQCFLPMLFRPVRSGNVQQNVLQPCLAKKAFGHLKRFAAFHVGHVTYDTWQEYYAAAHQASEELLEYGKLMERELADASTCTYNLHMLACRLPMQVLQRGSTHELNELWVERLIGEFKQRVKYRTRSEPEKTMVGDDMQKRALQRWRLAHPDMLTWQEFSKQSTRCHDRNAAWSDQGQLIGGSRLLAEQEWQTDSPSVRKAVECNMDATSQLVWLQNWDRLVVSCYKEAFLPGGSYANSTSYKRARSRDGSFVLVSFATPGGDLRPTVCRVNKYLRLSLPCDVVHQAPDLMVAVCDLLPYTKPLEDEDICGVDSMVLYGRDRGERKHTFQSLDYSVLLSTVTCPLFRQGFNGADNSKWWAFVPLCFKTGGKRS